MEEKRRSIRIMRPLLFRFKDSSGKIHLLSISNLNQEGIGMLSPVPFSEGEYLDVSLKLPSRPEEWHECRCRVLESKDITKYPGAFISGFRTRIKFDSISERTATFLKDYCDFVTKQNQKFDQTFEERIGVWGKEKEQRRTIRIHKSIVVMYSGSYELGPTDWDITAVRNISTSGAIFTTNTAFKKDSDLQLLIKIPLKPFNWIEFNGKVIESKQLKNLDDFSVGGTYLTRIKFFSVPMGNRELLEEYVEWFISYLKKLGDQAPI